jgi:hypothetical protein
MSNLDYVNGRVEAVLRAFVAFRLTIAILATTAVAGPVLANPSCPPITGGRVVFPDGAIVMNTGLAVNPDGAAASYAPGDRGYTYLSNGVNLIDNGRQMSCSSGGNAGRCRREWARAEAGGFRQGTPEFCVFAMEVEPLSARAQKIPCELPNRGRYVVGNGKGRPVSGTPVPTITGGSVTPYMSTTTLTHTRNGRTEFIDSATLPGLVAPVSRSDLVGAVAWVQFGGRSAFAIVNDTGPRFGEGSVALHQMLRNGRIGPSQPLGPIPVGDRCGPAEASLRPPFVSRPDGGNTDRCRAGHTPTTAADVRAYSGIDSGVISIILPAARPAMRGRTVTAEVTPALLHDLARAAGYTPEKLAGMAACVARQRL